MRQATEETEMTKIHYGMYEIAPNGKPEPDTTKIHYGMYALSKKTETPTINNNQQDAKRNARTLLSN